MRPNRTRPMSLLAALALLCSTAPAAPESAALAKRLLVGSRGKGGICVVAGREDAGLALAMSKQDRLVVHSLFTDRGPMALARKAIRSAGQYGQVSADLWSGDRLPYAENLINLLIVDGFPALRQKGFSAGEALRVLTPLGTAYLGDSRAADAADAKWVGELKSAAASLGLEPAAIADTTGTWLKVVKPWPEDIDEWTHYLHGADGNPVALDRVVGPPKHYQWTSKPTWMRSHETDSSVSTLVTARGRLFYIVDEAPTSLPGNHPLPDKWRVAARDAFNGVLLWKVPIQHWGWREWKHTWFSNRPGDIPLNLRKRLVAAGDRVYVTLGYRAPVSELDAATGAALQTYKGTERASEILYHKGTLILTLTRTDGLRVAAVNAKTGKTLWVTEKSYRGTTTDYVRWGTRHAQIEPPKLDATLNTATDGSTVAFVDGLDVVGVDFKTGKQIWRTKFPDEKENLYAGGIKLDALWVGTTIVCDRAVLHASPSKLVCFAADTGEVKWSQPKKYIGHLWYAWKDVFVIRGLVWTWSTEFGHGTYPIRKRTYRTNYPMTVNGYDLHSGELKKKVDLGKIFKTYHHHRCYRNKATLRYILASRRGTEFVDLEQGKHTVHNWVRGTCHMGMMPANGLHYAPPHPCACYINEKLNGFNALASQRPEVRGQKSQAAGDRLQRGPAYGETIENPKSKIDNFLDWPTYRHDSLRSGSTPAALPEQIAPVWNVKVGDKLSAPIVVGDKLFVSLVDEHHVVALSTDYGNKLWEFAAGARVDSPPTYYQGRVLFGSADGWVYCVRAADGELAWRFRAAPEDRRIGAFGQLESAWPVHGSVLVQNGLAYFAAGRSSHLDGGLFLYAVDAATGELRHQTKLVSPEYTVENVEQNYRLPMGHLPDILQGDGQRVSMRHLTFDSKLVEQKGGFDRVQVRSGFLDDAYFKRVPWRFGRLRMWGRLIVHDDRSVYCVRMFDTLRGLDPTNYFVPGKKGYLLLAGRKAVVSQIRTANSKSLNAPASPLTVEAWAKAEKPDGVVVAKGGSGTGYALLLKAGKPRFAIRAGGKVEAVAAEQNVVGKWVHLAGVVTDDKHLEIYVNGECAGRAKASWHVGPSGQAMEVGADLSTGAGDYESPFAFTGLIDEVTTYRRALTPTEIQRHYANPGQAPAKEKALVLYYSFDDGAAKDESGNGNDGTVDEAQPVEGKRGKAMRFVGEGTPGWSQRVHIRIRAMVAADKVLVVAGPPDVIDPKDPLGAFEGRKGARLLVVSTASGDKLDEHGLASPPVFNGMAAAAGRLFVCTTAGRAVCMAAKR